MDKLLVRIHVIIEMYMWNGLALWEFACPPELLFVLTSMGKGGLE
jgi:hypothetical protein